MVWGLSVLVTAVVLNYEHDGSKRDGIECQVRGGDDSQFEPGRWSWIPPGLVCNDPGGDATPTYWRVPWLLGFTVLPVDAAIAMRRKRSRRDGSP